MGTSGYEFNEFPWSEREPDARAERLCVGGLPLDCAIEGASFFAGETARQNEVTIVAYNVQRGIGADEQIERFLAADGVPAPDVLLLSEADRACSRSAGRNVAREYAQALGMRYVYAVEFVELPRFWGPDGAIRNACEHGNAIVSRYPLGNVRAIRHARARRWDSRCQRVLRIGEPRLGSRVALEADVRVGQRYLRLYSVHFESGDRYSEIRASQAAETADAAADVPFGAIIGGDMNVGAYVDDLHSGSASEPATQALFARGFSDAHAGLSPDQRQTTRSGAVIDVIAGKGVQFTGAGVGASETWGRLSDHLPVWARVLVA